MVFILSSCEDDNDRVLNKDLETLLSEIYSYNQFDGNTRQFFDELETVSIDEKNEKAYLGTSDYDYDKAITSIPSSATVPFELTLIRVAEDEDIDAMRKAIEENIDSDKWKFASVSPDNVIVDNIGDVIVIIMSDDHAQKLHEAFMALKLQLASKTYTYFDSSVTVKTYVPEGTDSDTLDEIFDGVDTRLENIHQLATRHESFEGVTNIRTINENPGEWHEVDPLLFELIETGIEYYELTDGYFDITLGPVLDLWNQSIEDCNDRQKDCSLPGETELESAGEAVGIDGISMNEDTHEVSIEEGMKLDLGGIAKGFAAERVSDYLKGYDVIDSFLINAGTSSIEIHGDHPTRSNNLWQVSITDPENPAEQGGLGAVQIPGDTSISTSGDYVRYFMKDGERYHHIINPETLYPSDHYRSVSLIMKSDGMSDVLSTSAFLMPPDASEAFIDELEDVEALWVMPDGSQKMTDGFEDHVFDWHD